MTFYSYIFNRAVQNIYTEILSRSPHDLRHTFASRLAMDGANGRPLQTLLAHKSQTMILRYAHLKPSHLWNAVEGLTRKGNGTVTKTVTKGFSLKE